FNVVGEMKGTQLPNEYVMLSAHFDSWDGGSGATDNGTGTITMLEAMRILKQVYPSPRRTILVGHWSGEEQGLNGSRGYVHDHPEIVSGRSEEHTSELQSRGHLVCRLLLEKKKTPGCDGRTARDTAARNLPRKRT